MISPNDVTKGLALTLSGEPYLMLDRRHISEAGRAKVCLKLRQLRSSARTRESGKRDT
jgi:translation elongation factor P/translation initiation factor 5A